MARRLYFVPYSQELIGLLVGNDAACGRDLRRFRDAILPACLDLVDPLLVSITFCDSFGGNNGGVSYAWGPRWVGGATRAPMLWALFASCALDTSREPRLVLVAEGEYFVIDALGEDDRVPRQFQSGDGCSGAGVERVRLNESSPIAPLAYISERISFRPCLHPGIDLWGDNFDLFASPFPLFLNPLPLKFDFSLAVEVVDAH